MLENFVVCVARQGLGEVSRSTRSVKIFDAEMDRAAQAQAAHASVLYTRQQVRAVSRRI
jgi:hypothetical protein